jgi:hypothetical protein
MILDTLLEETALVSAKDGRPFESRALRIQIFGQDEKRVEVLESKRKTALESKIRKRLLILMTCSVEFSFFSLFLGTSGPDRIWVMHVPFRLNASKAWAKITTS